MFQGFNWNNYLFHPNVSFLHILIIFSNLSKQFRDIWLFCFQGDSGGPLHYANETVHHIVGKLPSFLLSFMVDLYKFKPTFGAVHPKTKPGSGAFCVPITLPFLVARFSWRSFSTQKIFGATKNIWVDFSRYLLFEISQEYPEAP